MDRKTRYIYIYIYIYIEREREREREREILSRKTDRFTYHTNGQVDSGIERQAYLLGV